MLDGRRLNDSEQLLYILILKLLLLCYARQRRSLGRSDVPFRNIFVLGAGRRMVNFLVFLLTFGDGVKPSRLDNYLRLAYRFLRLVNLWLDHLLVLYLYRFFLGRRRHWRLGERRL